MSVMEVLLLFCYCDVDAADDDVSGNFKSFQRMKTKTCSEFFCIDFFTDFGLVTWTTSESITEITNFLSSSVATSYYLSYKTSLS